jgi:hypothetical protein
VLDIYVEIEFLIEAYIGIINYLFVELITDSIFYVNSELY